MFSTLEERFEYLKLNSKIGIETFGFDRWLNQEFYNSWDWRKFRRDIIVRDNGNEMGLEDNPINGLIVIHHLNPITVEDVVNGNPDIMDPNYVVCVSDLTHKAIHYGDKSLLPSPLIERKPNDTIPWR